MDEISLKTTRLWPYNSRQILEQKNICPDKLKIKFNYIYFPWDKSYDLERNYYSLTIQQRPLFIVQPINTHEIEHILDYCDEKNLRLRICNGRHSTQLLSPEVLIDMSRMDKIRLESNNILYVEGGARQGQVNEFLFSICKLNHYPHLGHFTYGKIKKGLSTGTAESVGVSVLITSCGIGALRRTLGLTIDVVEGYRITISPTCKSKAKTIYVDYSSYPDLFWALSGGGASNFGIVSEIKLKTSDAGKVIEYSVSWPWEEANKVIDLWTHTAPSRPNQFTEELDISKTLNKLGINLQGLYVIPKDQTDQEAVNTVKETIKYFGGEQDVQVPQKYSNIYLNLVQERSYYNFSIVQTSFVNKINSQDILDLMNKSLSLEEDVVIELELMGGIISENSKGSFGFRDCNFFVPISSRWNRLEDTESHKNWIELALSTFVKDGINGSYVGFPIPFDKLNKSLGNKIYYGKSYQELLKIKNYYDPKRLLTCSGTL